MAKQRTNRLQLPTGNMVRLGYNLKSSLGTVIPSSYTTYATVTATTLGGSVDLDYSAIIYDGNSGSARTGTIKVQCDGVDVPNSTINWYTLANRSSANVSFTINHTPTAGSHTWTVQVIAGTASATILDQVCLRVMEIGA